MQSALARARRDRATDLRIRDLLLAGLTVSSGSIDAISFVALGHVFSAFMTGNIVFLGLREAGTIDAPGFVALVVSIASFAAGVYVSTRIANPAQDVDTWPQRVTVALAGSLIPSGAFLGVWLAARGQPSVDVAHILLGLWAFAMGIQSAAVRALRVEGVFTTAATATVVLLAGDLTTWSGRVPERRRLGGVLVSLFIGAAAGGLLLVRARLLAPVLPVATSALVSATAAIVFREPRRA
jgi:uncharacterized membrane protein YoaK (UPF0700 family)